MSDVEEHDRNNSQAPKGCSRKMERCKAEDEKEEEDDEEEEDEDTDFNPCLIADTASEASSSLSSEDEGSADSSQRQPLQHSETVNTKVNREDEREIEVEKQHKAKKPILCGKKSTSPEDNTGETKRDSRPNRGEDDEDAICMRTRARHPLTDHTLEELETFLQESDDEDDLQNVDDEEEYRKFLSSVLSSGNDLGDEKEGNENMDEDEENDADFEIEIEEALDSDADENNQGNYDHKEKHRKEGRGAGRRPNRSQRASATHKNRPLSLAKTPFLRPILPFVTNTAVDSASQSHGWQPSTPQMIPHTSSKVEPICGFTSQQIGQLFCLMNEHVQLLIQVFSLSAPDPTRQHVAGKVELLLLEMADKREEAVARRRVPYPVYCFDYLDGCQSTHSVPSERADFPWALPFSNPMMSVLDVGSLGLAKKYIEDVSDCILRYKKDQMEGTQVGSQMRKGPLFPLQNYEAAQETTAEVIDGVDTTVCSRSSSAFSSQVQSKKTLAATLVEKTKKQSIALVPSDIAGLAKIFLTLFNPSLFPHKPPPSSVANRVLFTDSEDGLLAMGLMEYNNDWGAIRNRFLPCKSEHQIFVRQKNRSSSKAPENSIKAVRRMKTSPLTAEEKVLIAEGLKLFKHEWLSVWRLFVPHRDPSLLPRQWRIATGTQKSYRKDESVNEKRRLYEAKKRKLKASASDWDSMPADLEVDEAENEDEAYVHEAFLAENDQVGLEHLDSSRQMNEMSTVQQMVNPGAGSSGWSWSNSMPLTSKQVHYSYRMRKRKGAQVVKLAPELPPVNLPPSVRVISQSAFRSYQPALTSSKIPGKVMIPRLTQVSKTNVPKNGSGQDLREDSNCEADMQMHPLLFQMGDAEFASYHAEGSWSAASHAVAAAGGQSSIKVPPLGSEELHLTGLAMDFHPLLQRTSMKNKHSDTSAASVCKSQQSNLFAGGHKKDGSIDLEHSTSHGRKIDSGVSLIGQQEHDNASMAMGVDFESLPSTAGREDQDSPEIVMEQEELSDSEEEVDDVQFECEEMDDSEGEDFDAESASKIEKE